MKNKMLLIIFLKEYKNQKEVSKWRNIYHKWRVPLMIWRMLRVVLKKFLIHNYKEMNSDGNKILDAIKRMAADDNKGLIMTTTIVDVKDDPRGSIVGFGTEKVCGDDAFAQTMGLPGKYMACAFFIVREELKKYL